MGAAPLREASASAPHYERRRPEQTPLYRLVRQHYETFAAEVERATGTGLPQFVKDEFEAYLDCGILANGFLRLTQAAGTAARCDPSTSAGQALLANAEGFSLHAGVHCDAYDRQGIEQLCRYITRPAISNERLSENRQGNVVLKLKTPWRNGTTHLVLTPMEFMQRLAALVPRPRLHLIRFHGVLAPNAKLRSKVVPTARQQTTQGEGDCEHAHSKPVRMTWARLLKRVFDIDVERCQCGGKLKLVAVIEEPAVIEKILKHIGLDPQPPPRAPARKRVDLLEWA